jgi:hypothetical protein
MLQLPVALTFIVIIKGLRMLKLFVCLCLLCLLYCDWCIVLVTVQNVCQIGTEGARFTERASVWSLTDISCNCQDCTGNCLITYWHVSCYCQVYRVSCLVIYWHVSCNSVAILSLIKTTRTHSSPTSTGSPVTDARQQQNPVYSSIPIWTVGD